MKNISRTSLVLIAAGLYLALGGIAGYSTVNALVLLWIGIERYRLDRNRLSVLVIAISAIVLVANQIGLVLVLLLIVLGVYYMKARPSYRGRAGSHTNLTFHMREDQPGWVMKSLSSWHLFGEVRLDLSYSVPEEKETVIVLQGVVGDIDIIVPEDYGLQVESNILVGNVTLGGRSEGGLLHRTNWNSPGYDQQEQRLKLQLFYLVGHIKIRPI